MLKSPVPSQLPLLLQSPPLPTLPQPSLRALLLPQPPLLLLPQPSLDPTDTVPDTWDTWEVSEDTTWEDSEVTSVDSVDTTTFTKFLPDFPFLWLVLPTFSKAFQHTQKIFGTCNMKIYR